MIITKNAVRVYEDKTKALSTYGRPIVAIPLAAVKRAERLKFDTRDDTRFENTYEKNIALTKNIFEFQLKDEFLPIYTHQYYTKIFKETSISMELSPRKRPFGKMKSNLSPMRDSRISNTNRSSIMTGGPSPARASHMLDMHKRTGHELK